MVIARMAKCLLLMAVVMVTSVLPAGGARCGSGSIKCWSSSECISHSSLCDGSLDCPGQGEDEDQAWCAMYISSKCSRGSTPCTSNNYNYANEGCEAWETACDQRCSSATPSPEVCKAIKSNLLPRKEEDPEHGIASQIDIKELVSFMSATNCSLERTSKLTNQSSGCPQLYTSIGGMCIAPLPFVLTWPEALIACQSIAGKLLEVEFIEKFAEIVQFLIKADFSSNFWTGGFYDIEKEDWTWSTGPKMPRSTPYWAVKHTDTCNTRQSNTLGALPGCFHYKQAPTSKGTGYCAALQFKYMYYISDEGCFHKKYPLCIH